MQRWQKLIDNVNKSGLCQVVMSAKSINYCIDIMENTATAEGYNVNEAVYQYDSGSAGRLPDMWHCIYNGTSAPPEMTQPTDCAAGFKQTMVFPLYEKFVSSLSLVKNYIIFPPNSLIAYFFVSKGDCLWYANINMTGSIRWNNKAWVSYPFVSGSHTTGTSKCPQVKFSVPVVY